MEVLCVRLIQVIVPPDKRDEVTEYLRSEDVDFAVTHDESGHEYTDVVTFPVVKEEVEEVLDKFREFGVEEDGYIIVSEAEAVVSDRWEEKLEKREEESRGREEDVDTGRISRDELRTTATGLSRSTSNYILFTVISAVVATAGLITDSAAIVVGSMVIAPLIGPAMASSVGSVINDDELFLDGVKSQFLGVGVAVFSATVFAFLVRLLVVPNPDFFLINQVTTRVNPGVLALVVALGSGVAGALSLTSGASTALVGVMIAVALIPPAASLGLGLAYQDPVVAASATVLVLVNLLSINLAGLVTLWAKGYRPEKWYEEKVARRTTLKRIGALVLGVVVLSSFLVVSTIDSRHNNDFQEEVTELVHSQDPNADIEFTYRDDLFSTRVQRVTVITDTDTDLDASDLKRRIQETTNQDPEIVVLHRSIDRSG